MTQPGPDRSTSETSVVPPPTNAGPSTPPGAPIDPAHRHVMVAEAAFYIAQARGFTPSQELDDWLAAEREIEQLLANREL